MRKLLGILLRQHQLGQSLGAAKSSFSRTLVYVSYFNFSMIAAMAYDTFREPLVYYVPWLTFRAFWVAIGIGLLMLMLLDYKFMLPSEWNYTQDQMWKHMNPVRTELEEVRKELKTIKKTLKIIMKKIDKGGS